MKILVYTLALVFFGLATSLPLPISIESLNDGQDVIKTAGYDEKEALKMVYYSAAAYCLKRGNEWNCGKACTFNRFSLYATVYNYAHDAYGYVGKDLDTGNVVVAFKGSNTLRNWIDNLRIFQVSRYDHVPDATVHRGFLESYLSIEDQLYAAIESIPGTKRIVLTGHSLGGALATLAAVDLRERGYTVEKLYTFGSPRVGNQAFASFLHTHTKTWRIVHEDDIVPGLPPYGLSFHHFPTEVWYHDGAYRVCSGPDEDQTCSFSLDPLDRSVTAHMYYMNVGVCDCENAYANNATMAL